MNRTFYLFFAVAASILFIVLGFFIIWYYVLFLRTSLYAPIVSSLVLYCAAGFSVYRIYRKRKRQDDDKAQQ